MVAEHICWTFSNILLALLPILFTFMVRAWICERIDWITLLKDGELCFFSTAISASSVGNMLLRDPINKTYAIIVGSMLLLIIFLSMLMYTLTTIKKHATSTEQNGFASPNPEWQDKFVSTWSVIFAICAGGLSYITFIITQ